MLSPTSPSRRLFSLGSSSIPVLLSCSIHVVGRFFQEGTRRSGKKPERADRRKAAAEKAAGGI